MLEAPRSRRGLLPREPAIRAVLVAILTFIGGAAIAATMGEMDSSMGGGLMGWLGRLFVDLFMVGPLIAPGAIASGLCTWILLKVGLVERRMLAGFVVAIATFGVTGLIIVANGQQGSSIERLFLLVYSLCSGALASLLMGGVADCSTPVDNPDGGRAAG